ncbi:hypothetical protein C1752_00927 [Acaryochloris thomasi RCC1774]|uniref:Uncharacterized protein n=1 Tax=Acaryochloris thomasi RCC1774 TaxID=1764569 RepID=A0A2W1JN73_9CYAN|nr:hypothetical protein [Acaryochloris thomasi]PZD74739.1 hypothetical protein C1752_00927 [Acaryochloris thomasi RCC1774]
MSTKFATRFIGHRPSWRVAIATLPAVIISSAFLAVPAQAQSLDGLGEGQQVTPTNVEPLSPDVARSGLFSIAAGKNLMAESESAVASQNYDLAAKKLQDSRSIFNQLSNFYQALTSSFQGVSRVAADSHRRKALETAQLRDQATYQLALVYRSQSKPEKSIPLLIEIIRSQNPTRDLGKKSYQQLVELGFVDAPLPKTQTKENKKSKPVVKPEEAAPSAPTPSAPPSVVPQGADIN